MVSRNTLGVSPVIRLGLGLVFAASVMAFDMSLNTNVCLLCLCRRLSMLMPWSSWQCMSFSRFNDHRAELPHLGTGVKTRSERPIPVTQPRGNSP